MLLNCGRGGGDGAGGRGVVGINLDEGTNLFFSELRLDVSNADGFDSNVGERLNDPSSVRTRLLSP